MSLFTLEGLEESAVVSNTTTLLTKKTLACACQLGVDLVRELTGRSISAGSKSMDDAPYLIITGITNEILTGKLSPGVNTNVI